jgi:hypothetical protein
MSCRRGATGSPCLSTGPGSVLRTPARQSYDQLFQQEVRLEDEL